VKPATRTADQPARLSIPKGDCVNEFIKPSFNGMQQKMIITDPGFPCPEIIIAKQHFALWQKPSKNAHPTPKTAPNRLGAL
jgi:hypothetical protein